MLPSGACVNGVCTCPEGSMICKGYCTNVTSNVQSCGVCGQRCPFDQVCAAGQCVAPSCPAGQTSAIGQCYDTSFDPANCGAIAHVCAGGQVCVQGQCATS